MSESGARRRPPLVLLRGASFNGSPKPDIAFETGVFQTSIAPFGTLRA